MKRKLYNQDGETPTLKNMSEEQAFSKLSALCASSEHCSGEMKEKMEKWLLPEDVQTRIMQRLIDDKFIDDERFCKFYVRDKIRYNKWGRKKIEQALYMKNIDPEISCRVLDDVDEQEYIDVLVPLLKSKRKSTHAASEYELNGKLIRFALGRGFDMNIIKKCLEI